MVECRAHIPTRSHTDAGSWIAEAGTITAVLACLGIPCIMVRPNEWKKALGLVKAEKDQSRALAIQRFPAAATYLQRVKDPLRLNSTAI